MLSMSKGSATKHTDEGALLTEVVLAVFRLQGRLIQDGDRLVSGVGLTSARWQVLGAIALTDARQTIARLARAMGLTRQSVRRIVNDLVADGLLERLSNPNHARADLLQLTAAGRRAYAAATARQIPWANQLAVGFSRPKLADTLALLQTMVRRLEEGSVDDDGSTHRRAKTARRTS